MPVVTPWCSLEITLWPNLLFVKSMYVCCILVLLLWQLHWVVDSTSGVLPRYLIHKSCMCHLPTRFGRVTSTNAWPITCWSTHSCPRVSTHRSQLRWTNHDQTKLVHWVNVFVSLYVKAIHMEHCFQLDHCTEAFLADHCHFIVRHGNPAIMWSDHMEAHPRTHASVIFGRRHAVKAWRSTWGRL